MFLQYLLFRVLLVQTQQGRLAPDVCLLDDMPLAAGFLHQALQRRQAPFLVIRPNRVEPSRQ